MEKHLLPATSADPYKLMEGVIVELNKRDIGSSPEDPSVAIVIKTTGEFINGGEAEYSATVYIGATEEEIANDLMPAPVKVSS